jgi:hypothetical protein
MDLLEGLIIGAHLVSAHSAGGLNAHTPGLYLRMPAGFTAGFYENSISRTALAGQEAGARRISRYVGWTWQTHSGRYALTLGAVDGYGRPEQETCRPNTAPPIATASSQAVPSPGCSYHEHHAKVRDVVPLAVFSSRLPLTAGWAARMGYAPVPASVRDDKLLHVAHVMLERSF